MKRLALLAVLTFAAGSLSGAPVITSVSPLNGPKTGGTKVTIKGSGFHEIPGAPTIYFGRLEATRETFDDSTIIVRTPRNVPGTAIVRVIVREAEAIAAQPFTFEGEAPILTRILLPMLVPPVRGAFGSEWITELRMTASTEFPQILVRGLEPAGGWDPTWSPGEPLRVGRDSTPRNPTSVKYSGSPGRFIYIDREELPGLQMNLRVSDRSRANENLGTEIRIVGEDEFRTNADREFFDVPVSSRARATLRVYAAAPTAVGISIDDIGLRDLQLRPGADEFDPAYAEMTLPFGGGSVSIRPRGSVPVWAFISLTNNETQMVTTITPQR